MNFPDYLSNFILIAGAGLAVRGAVRSVKNFLDQDLTLTNKRTGKSVTLGKHHRTNLSNELLEVLD